VPSTELLLIIQLAGMNSASILHFGDALANKYENYEVTMKKSIAVILSSLCLSLPALAEDNSHMDSAKEASGEAWENTKEASSEAWEATKEGSEKAWDATKETSSEAWDATKEAVGAE
jgi:hypothetical protein